MCWRQEARVFVLTEPNTYRSNGSNGVIDTETKSSRSTFVGVLVQLGSIARADCQVLVGEKKKQQPSILVVFMEYIHTSVSLLFTSTRSVFVHDAG